MALARAPILGEARLYQGCIKVIVAMTLPAMSLCGAVEQIVRARYIVPQHISMPLAYIVPLTLGHDDDDASLIDFNALSDATSIDDHRH